MLSEKLKQIIMSIPPAITGVYFFKDANGRIIYIGKSNDIRKRLYQHFTNTVGKAARMQSSVHTVSFENMGNELMALLRESELIKLHKPLYNRAQRRSIYLWGIYKEILPTGYGGLHLQKIDPERQELIAFTSKKEGREYLFRITEMYGLCQKINGLYPTTGACFQYALKTCQGACVGVEPPTSYNLRVWQYIKDVRLPEEDRTIVLEGREADEAGIVLIEKGIYRGYAFVKKKTLPKVAYGQVISRKEDNRDTHRLIKRFLQRLDGQAAE